MAVDDLFPSWIFQRALPGLAPHHCPVRALVVPSLFLQPFVLSFTFLALGEGDFSGGLGRFAQADQG